MRVYQRRKALLVMALATLAVGLYAGPIGGDVFPVSPPMPGWRPLHALADALCARLGGGLASPKLVGWPFHLYGVLLHALVAWRVFALGAKLLASPWLALLSATLFLVHPAVSEAVISFPSTGVVQMSFFYLLGLSFFWEARQCGPRGFTAASLACFACALLSDESAISFPLALVASVFLLRRRLKENLSILAAAFLVLAAYLAAHAAFAPIAAAHYPAPSYPLGFRLTQPWAWCRYLLWLVAPWGFWGNYEHYPLVGSPYDPRFLAGAALVACALGLACWAAFRRLRGKPAASGAARECAFAFAWYFLAILPESGWWVLPQPLAEHRAYLAYTLLFPAALAGARLLVVRVSRRIRLPKKALAAIASFVALVPLGWATVSRNAKWRDEASFWRSVLEKDPTHPGALAAVAAADLARGDITDAYSKIQFCLDRNAEYWPCLMQSYQAYRWNGMPGSAMAAIRAAAKAAPGSGEVQTQYAKAILEIERDPIRALAAATRCETLTGGTFPGCFMVQMEAHFVARRYGDAVAAGRKAIALDPSGAMDAHLRLGQSLLELKRWDEAERELREYQARDPGNTAPLLLLAAASSGKKDYRAARERLLALLRLEPGNEAAMRELLAAARKLGDRELADKVVADLARITTGKSARSTGSR